jgi:hypothetical protein
MVFFSSSLNQNRLINVVEESDDVAEYSLLFGGKCG